MAKMGSLYRVFKGLPVAVVGFSALLLINGCEAIWPVTAQDYDSSLPKHELKVAGLIHPLSVTPQNNSGFERELIEKFAAERNYYVTWKLFKSADEVRASLDNHESDLAAARLNLNLAFQGNYLPGPTYEESPLSLVCPRVSREDNDETSSLFQSLFGKRTKIPDAVKTVLALNSDLAGEWQAHFNSNFPGLKLLPVDRKQAKDLLKTVAVQRTACALVVKTEAQFYLRFFPSLQSVRDVTPPISLGFLLSPHKTDLQRELFQWFQRSSRNHEIEHLRDLYFSHLATLNELDSIRLFRDMEVELPVLISHFKKISRQFGLPWALLAAVAYQESHWDNDAESFTGVKGIMMLTQDTADQVGIDDREDLEQSLWGGAKYLKHLINAQPKDLPARQRIIMALAAYNVGPAHIIDAQALAQQFDLNPTSWLDLKKVLPLLSEPEYYDNPEYQLRYGECRGQEPIDYANRVISYYELLSTKI